MKWEADELVRRGADIYQVQYDELVRDPATTLNAICEFIGIDSIPRWRHSKALTALQFTTESITPGVKSSSIVAETRAGRKCFLPSLRQGQRLCRAIGERSRAGTVARLMQSSARGTQAASVGGADLGCAFGTEFLRTADLAVPLAYYAFVPMPIWQKYREMKSKYQRVATKPSESERHLKSLPVSITFKRSNGYNRTAEMEAKVQHIIASCLHICSRERSSVNFRIKPSLLLAMVFRGRLRSCIRADHEHVCLV